MRSMLAVLSALFVATVPTVAFAELQYVACNYGRYQNNSLIERRLVNLSFDIDQQVAYESLDGGRSWRQARIVALTPDGIYIESSSAGYCFKLRGGPRGCPNFGEDNFYMYALDHASSGPGHCEWYRP